jgi:hypothetical protein
MREYGPGRPLVFNHIPKSGGTSLSATLSQALGVPVPTYGVDLALVGGYDDIDALDDAIRSTFVFEPSQLPADATFVTGHISPATTMARYPDADHLTTLRNPRLRMLSQWLHSRALSDFDLRHWGRGGIAMRLGRLPFEQYLQHEMVAPNVDNTMTRFLAWPHPELKKTEFIDERFDDELYAAAIERLDRFAHVGLLESPTYLADLGAWLGRELVDVHLNERSSMPRSRRPDLDVELCPANVELLDHRTRLDRRVWQEVVRRTMPGQDPDELLRSSWQRSIDRYAVSLHERGEFRPVRRTAEVLYGLKVRLSPRDRDRFPV